MRRIFVEGFWLLVAVGIVFGGVAGFQILGASKPVVEAEAIQRSVVLAEVEPLRAATAGIPINTNGFMSAAQQLDIAAETSGRIVQLHPAVLAHGKFAKNDVLFRLDDRQARASLAQITANTESALAQLALLDKQLERSRALRGQGIISQGQLDELESREVELNATLRGLDAYQKAAELSLANTVVRAPFDGRVLEQLAEEAAVISSGTPVARIYSDDRIEIEIAVREDEAVLFPDLFGSPDIAARIETDFAGQRYVWNAGISRVERRIDDQTRTIDVTLALEQPERGMPVSGKGLPIPALINAYVDVHMLAPGTGPDAGPDAGSVFVASAQTIRNGADIWVADDDKVSIQPIQVLHRDGDEVYFLANTLAAGAEIITNPLAAVSEGMEIEVVRETASLNVPLGDQ
ncbi:MAG: efflux RND transporter periplasmic adaptor subunit [Pseudomonadota bacterium]